MFQTKCTCIKQTKTSITVSIIVRSAVIDDGHDRFEFHRFCGRMDILLLTIPYFAESGVGLGFAKQLHTRNHPSTANCTWKYITQVQLHTAHLFLKKRLVWPQKYPWLTQRHFWFYCKFKPLDHFGDAGGVTWQERYCLYDSYWKKASDAGFNVDTDDGGKTVEERFIA